MALRADAVFEGGGVKGIGLVGAVVEAERRGYRWVNLAGTSAGAVVAALLAAGYSGHDIRGFLLDLDYREFRDLTPMARFPLVGPLASLLLENGLCQGRYLETWLGVKLADRGVHTFGDLVLEDFQGDPRYRYRFQAIAADLSRRRMLVLPRDLAVYGIDPDTFPVVRAVRMSMSIPFFYRPVTVRYRGPGGRRRLSVVVDGGVLSNYPVWLFDSPGVPEWPSFGFKLVEPGTGPVTPPGGSPADGGSPGVSGLPTEGRSGGNPGSGGSGEIRGPVALLAALFSTMMEAHDARYIEDHDFVRTIPIPTLGVGTVEFDLGREQAEALYQAGVDAARDFFDTWDFRRYVESYRMGSASRGWRGKRLRAGA